MASVQTAVAKSTSQMLLQDPAVRIAGASPIGRSECWKGWTGERPVKDLAEDVLYDLEGNEEMAIAANDTEQQY